MSNIVPDIRQVSQITLGMTVLGPVSFAQNFLIFSKTYRRYVLRYILEISNFFGPHPQSPHYFGDSIGIWNAITLPV